MGDTCSDFSFCTQQDAYDAMGYFHLALAAALEDEANPEALYVVYMKLAEIHGNHMPYAQLCQVYRDRAQSLKRVLAGEGGSATAAVGKINTDDTDAELGQRKDTDFNVECTERLAERKSSCTLTSENTKHGDNSFLGDTNGLGDQRNNHPEVDGTFVDAYETTASQSYSDSILTESFDTAKEQITDSSSSTDTLQTYQDQKDRKNASSSIPGKHTWLSENTDPDFQNEQSTLTCEKAAPADTDISLTDNQPDSDHTETVSVNTDRAESNTSDCTEKEKSADTAHSQHLDLDDVYT